MSGGLPACRIRCRTSTRSFSVVIMSASVGYSAKPPGSAIWALTGPGLAAGDCSTCDQARCDQFVSGSRCRTPYHVDEVPACGISNNHGDTEDSSEKLHHSNTTGSQRPAIFQVVDFVSTCSHCCSANPSSFAHLTASVS